MSITPVSVSHNLRSIFLAALAVFGTNVLGQNVVIEPPLPTAPAVDEGYFPTLAESALLRGPSDARSVGGGALDMEEGPDIRRQTATGIFPYEDSRPNFYQRNQDFFRPLDQLFGFMTPHDALTIEADRFDNTSLTLDARLGVLTRQFSPELAMVKAGPLYFDVLWLGAGVIWSDFNGNNAFASPRGGRNGDGATGYIDIGVRGLLRFTDTVYLSVVGNLIYLPFENEVALRFGSGREAGLYSRLNYSETFGAWDILLYSEFQGRPGLNWYGQGTASDMDRAGRYFFGFQTQGRANEFYNSNFVFFTNKLGLNATRLVFENQWRLGIAVDHTDFWRTFSFNNHRKRDHVGVWLGYEGSIIPFAPRFSYDIYSYDGYNSLWHRFFLDLTGRITENINWMGRAGGAFTTGVRREMDQFLWEIGLDHTITRNTSHWVRFGEGIFDNEVSAESLTSRFVTWGIDQRIERRLYARAFLQFSDSETVIPSLQLRERFGGGLTVRYQPLDFTQILASVVYENIDQALPTSDVDRWLYRLEVTQQLGHRLTGHLYYQYEDKHVNPGNFSEHVIGLSARRYF